MADIVITINISAIYKEVARRSSIATETDPYYANMSTEKKQLSQLHGEGDRITADFVKEAAKEVQKAYLNRQGDVTGDAFEYDLADSDNIVYRFAENSVPLAANQTAAYVTRLTNNTKDAIIYYVLVSLYRTDGNQKKEAELLDKALELIDNLSSDLHKLHD